MRMVKKHTTIKIDETQSVKLLTSRFRSRANQGQMISDPNIGYLCLTGA